MDINLVVMDDGQVALAVPEGEFEEAADSLREFIKTLQMGDIPIVMSGQPEQHKHAQKYRHARVNTGG